MTQTANHKTTIARPDWLHPDVWPFDVRTVEIDGTPLAYTDEGEGPALLLVHDGMWSFIWGQAISRLRERFRVITLDFPGSGLSPGSNTAVGLESDSHLLTAFCDQLGLDDVTVVAHDLGGGVSMGMAVRKPERVNGLILVNTFAWPPHVRSLRAMLAVVGSRPLTWLDTTTNFIPRLTSSKAGVGRHLDELGKEAFVAPFLDRGPTSRFHQLMASVAKEETYLARVESGLSDQLSDKPVLTIYGEKNDPFGFQAKFKEIFPDAEEIIVPEGNHFPMCDDPDGFAAWITDWHRRVVG